MMTRIAAVAAASAALLLLSGCASEASSSSVSAVGTWGAEGQGLPQLVLAEDGSLSGTDGCNRLMGSWEQDGDTVKFLQVASTMMACTGVDTWLSTLDSAQINAEALLVKDSSGADIGTLAKS